MKDYSSPKKELEAIKTSVEQLRNQLNYSPTEATKVLKQELTNLWCKSSIHEKLEIILEVDPEILKYITEPLLTQDELCYWLNLAPASVLMLRRNHKIPFIYVGGQLRFERLAVLRSLYLNQKVYKRIFQPRKRMKIDNAGELEKE